MRYKLKEPLGYSTKREFTVNGSTFLVTGSVYSLTDLGDLFLLTGHTLGGREMFCLISKDFTKSSNWNRTIELTLNAHQRTDSRKMITSRLNLWVNSRDNLVPIDVLVNNNKDIRLIKDVDEEWYLVGH